MQEIKSQGTVKKIAEIADVSKWPISTAKTAFQPGTIYNVGTITSSTFSYTLSGGAEGAQWYFCFETGSTVPEIIHPSGVKIGTFKVKANQHVDISLLQVGGKKWLVAEGWDL